MGLPVRRRTSFHTSDGTHSTQSCILTADVINSNAGAVIVKIAYGWTVTSNDDVLVNSKKEGVRIAEEMVQPGRWLVEIFPLLRFVPSWVPGARFKRRAAYAKHRLNSIDTDPFNWAKEQIVRHSHSVYFDLLVTDCLTVAQKSGEYVESFTSIGLNADEGKPPSAEEEDILKWCTAALYTGGADTVSPLPLLHAVGLH